MKSLSFHEQLQLENTYHCIENFVIGAGISIDSDNIDISLLANGLEVLFKHMPVVIDLERHSDGAVTS